MTVNIAWSSSPVPLGDAEYLAAMRTIVTPIIKVNIFSWSRYLDHDFL